MLEDGGTILGVTFDSGVSFGEYRVSINYALLVADDTTQSAREEGAGGLGMDREPRPYLQNTKNARIHLKTYLRRTNTPKELPTAP